MIKIDLPSRTIGIAFKHPKVHRVLERGDGHGDIVETVERRCSVCEVFEIDGAGNPTLISKGVVHCHFLDSFKRETGRKKALASALTKCSMNKWERRRIWDAYHNRGAETTMNQLTVALEKALSEGDASTVS